jgi:hypothetical protein
MEARESFDSRQIYLQHGAPAEKLSIKEKALNMMNERWRNAAWNPGL